MQRKLSTWLRLGFTPSVIELERRMKFAGLTVRMGAGAVLRGLEALQQNSAHLHARAQSCGTAPEMIKYKNVVTFSYSLVH